MVKIIFIGKQCPQTISIRLKTKEKDSNIDLFHCGYDTQKGL